VKAAFQVQGWVQGVGFRYFIRRHAQELDLGGWVRNEFDGTVSGEVEGDPAPLEAFRELLERGPSGARITRLDWYPVESGGPLPFPFSIRM